MYLVFNYKTANSQSFFYRLKNLNGTILTKFRENDKIYPAHTHHHENFALIFFLFFSTLLYIIIKNFYKQSN